VNRAARLGVVVRDWLHVLGRQAVAVVGRTPPDAYAPPAASGPCAAAPVVLLPGIWEPWRYLRPLAASLHRAGHAVHPVPGLGWNGRDLAASADVVARFLKERDLSGVVLVAHSKGGLIGKHVMLHSGAAARVRGLVAVCTPFGGSSLARAAFARTPLGVFAPTGAAIVALATEEAVNGHICSIGSAWDEMVPQGTELPGARNITLDIPGHFRPVADPGVHALVHREVDALAHREDA